MEFIYSIHCSSYWFEPPSPFIRITLNTHTTFTNTFQSLLSLQHNKPNHHNPPHTKTIPLTPLLLNPFKLFSFHAPCPTPTVTLFLPQIPQHIPPWLPDIQRSSYHSMVFIYSVHCSSCSSYWFEPPSLFIRIARNTLTTSFIHFYISHNKQHNTTSNQYQTHHTLSSQSHPVSHIFSANSTLSPVSNIFSAESTTHPFHSHIEVPNMTYLELFIRFGFRQYQTSCIL